MEEKDIKTVKTTRGELDTIGIGVITTGVL